MGQVLQHCTGDPRVKMKKTQEWRREEEEGERDGGV